MAKTLAIISLTPHSESPKDDAADSAEVESAGAPEDEIREAAIDAGVRALAKFDPMDWAEAWVSSRDIASALFDAMLQPIQRSR